MTCLSFTSDYTSRVFRLWPTVDIGYFCKWSIYEANISYEALFQTAFEKASTGDQKSVNPNLVIVLPAHDLQMKVGIYI